MQRTSRLACLHQLAIVPVAALAAAWYLIWPAASFMPRCCTALLPAADTVMAPPSRTAVGRSSLTPNLIGAKRRSAQLPLLPLGMALQVVQSDKKNTSAQTKASNVFIQDLFSEAPIPVHSQYPTRPSRLLLMHMLRPLPLMDQSPWKDPVDRHVNRDPM